MRVLPLVTALALTLSPAGARSAPEAPAERSEQVERALQLLAAGEDGQAVAELERLRAGGEASPFALGLLGALYVEAGRPAEALEVLGPLADADNADPAVLYNAGRAALAIGDEGRGEAFLSRSVAAAPVSPAARELGMLRARQERRVEAYRLLRPWALGGGDAEARKAAAALALQLGRVPEAEELLAGLPAEEPEVRLLWANLLLLKGDPQGAVERAEPIRDEHPPQMDLDVRRVLAEAYVLTGRAAEAVELLRGRLAGDRGLTHLMGKAQYQSGDPEGALATLGPAVQRFFERHEEGGAPRELMLALGGIGLDYSRALVALGRHQEAVGVLERVVEVDSESSEAWHLLGQALAGSGRSEDARAALDRFRELSAQELPTSARTLRFQQELEDPGAARLRRGVELLRQGQAEEALAVVREEIELAPDDLRPRLLEVRLLLALDRPDEAQRSAEELLALAPGNGDALYSRGTVHMARREPGDAERLLRQALAVVPDHAGALNDLAVLLMLQDRGEEARELLERLVALRPEDALARENLERLRAGGAVSPEGGG